MSCYLPVSSQKAKTGRADFITEYLYLYAVTLVVGWSENWGALLHHPPLVCLSLGRSSDLLKFDWHGPEESEVWAIRVLWGKACKIKLHLLNKISAGQINWISRWMDGWILSSQSSLQHLKVRLQTHHKQSHTPNELHKCIQIRFREKNLSQPRLLPLDIISIVKM